MSYDEILRTVIRRAFGMPPNGPPDIDVILKTVLRVIPDNTAKINGRFVKLQEIWYVGEGSGTPVLEPDQDQAVVLLMEPLYRIVEDDRP